MTLYYSQHLLSNGNLDINARLNVEGGNLLDNLRRREEINGSLVDAHLVSVPGLGTLTVGGLTGGDLKNLGRQSHGSLGLQRVGLGSVDNVGRHTLQLLELGGGHSDADLEELFLGLGGLFLVEAHFDV